MFTLNRGDWVQYKGQFARVHGAYKNHRYLIETAPDQDGMIYRHWVRPLNTTPLDHAVSSILESLNNKGE
jgi:hypothetical protein